MLEALLDLVLPRRCVGCARGGPLLCAACRGTQGAGVVPCGDLTVVAAAEYGDAVRRALIAYKERGRRDLAAPLGVLLAEALARLLTETTSGAAGPLPDAPISLVCIPSSRAAAGARGGEHVVRLARRAVRELPRGTAAGVHIAPQALRLVREVQDSAGLGAVERRRNLYAAMRAEPPPPPAPGRAVPRPAGCAVLLDDIVTSGATLREARRALTAAGWTLLGAAVVAATPKRVGPSHWQVPGNRSSVWVT